MELTVQRDTFTDQSTTGKLSIDGEFFCFTLEPRFNQAQGKPYCIPAGRYRVELTMSPRFQMVTPHLIDVPDFTAIEIHPGNYPSDTEACLLVGLTRRVDFVGTSRLAFDSLMKKLATADNIWITYTGEKI